MEKTNNFNIGTCVITYKNEIGVIVDYNEVIRLYFVRIKDTIKQYTEEQIIEWHGAW